MSAEYSEQNELDTTEGQKAFFEEQGFEKLGKYGLVAFAARAALRVMPVLGKRGYLPPEEDIKKHLEAIDQNIYWAINYVVGFWREDFFNSVHASASSDAFDTAHADYASADADYFNTNRLISYASNSDAEADSDYAESYYTYTSARLASYAAADTGVASYATSAASVADTIYAAAAEQKTDIEWLLENDWHNKPTIDFFKRDLWDGLDSKPEGWEAIENNFKTALEAVGLPEIWENYNSGGLRYLEIDPLNYIKKEKNISLIPSGIKISNRDNAPPVLNVEKQAEIMARVLENLGGNTGQFVGLFGRWGRGKTFFWKELWKSLSSNDKNPFIKVEFHAWKYQDTPASWAYLYQTLSDTYLGSKYRFWKYYPRLILLNTYRGAWKDILFLIISIIGVIVYYYHFSESTLSIENWESFVPGVMWLSPAITWGLFQSIRKRFSTRAIEIFHRTAKKVSFDGHLGAQAEIQTEMVRLLQVWGFINNDLWRWLRKSFKRKKILLFIDDIDRCDEEKLVPIVDSIRVMLDDEVISKHMIVLAAVDERILKMAIAKKYRKMEHNGNGHILATLEREYMDKLFIASIKLNKLADEQLGEVMNAITGVNGERKTFSLVNPKDILDNKEPKGSGESEGGEAANEKLNFTNAEESRENSNTNSQEKKEESISEKAKTSIKEKPDEVEETIEIEHKSEYLLEAAEYEILKKYLPDFIEATPRTMHIYLYRYVLGIRLLRTMGASLPLDDTMKEENSYYSLLASLIVYYSSQKTVEEISAHANNAKNSKVNNDGLIDFAIHHNKINVPKERILEIYTVLEMVVAY